MFFLWIVITDYVLIDYHHEIGSSCVGYVIMSTKFNHKFIKAYYDPFKVCDQYKKCGCIDTIDGYHWTLYAGITTKTLSKASDGMHSWVRKLMIISNSNFIFKNFLQRVWGLGFIKVLIFTESIASFVLAQTIDWHLQINLGRPCDQMNLANYKLLSLQLKITYLWFFIVYHNIIVWIVIPLLK